MSEVKQLLQDMVDTENNPKICKSLCQSSGVGKKEVWRARFCIDYRRLNLVTVKDSFPLSRIDESLEAMGGSQFFSSLDLSHGYFQIAMQPDSMPYTAFRVPWGLFEFERMPQGLCNSPSTFQRVMEIIFGDMNLSQLILYLDDILTFSATLEQHLDRLQTVFQRLIQHGLKLKGEKCNFLQREVQHLGHVVSAEGVSVDHGKVDRIVNWPIPTTLTELASFLGLASYYRKFVPNLAKLAAPLHSLKKTDTTTTAGNKSRSKQSPLKWNKEADEAFRQLKTLLSSSPVLAYPRFDREFVLEIDASLKGLGCCLLQRDDAGLLHSIAYASRGLRDAEKNYSDFSSFKLELLGLKWAVSDKFREYLMGSRCLVLTDNNPLAHLDNAKLGATEQRWVAQLASFNLDIQYRPGRLNRCADALSRCPSKRIGEDQLVNVDTATYICKAPEPSLVDFDHFVTEVTACSALPIEVVRNPLPEDNPPEEITRPSIFPSFSFSQLADLQKKDDALSVVWECWTSDWQPGEELRQPCTPEIKSWLREFSKIVERQASFTVKSQTSGQGPLDSCLCLSVCERDYWRWLMTTVDTKA
ncbi:putative transposon Ty3-I Gag-Pol polyprotein [Apostichopus japonicus]|uniref:Putative transposon Ty3-I Gag-Pol polyprotein n=1 Tax=Stichopus japonicus TaxID=307972 RepID=A0A2G8K9T5_STIJA|nr:putative transposon Ty3-I Gag-Pol polyprotein [Apostichopus japonicus]